MKPISIFISSPGDVQDERETTEAIIHRIASEYGLPVDIRYSALSKYAEASSNSNEREQLDSHTETLVLCPYFWEYQRFHGDEGYQEQIPRTDQFDLVVCILWARMGSNLRAELKNPDNSTPRSGTEYEIQWARHARQLARQASPETPSLELTPALHVYRNTSQATPPNESDKGREFYDQRDALNDFVDEWQRAKDGSFKGAFNTYQNLGEFERKFEAHIRDFLQHFLPEETTRPTNPTKLLWNPLEKGSPFRRLDVYEMEHEPVFCGRRRATGEVLSALRRQHQRGTPFTLILGASGSGKSSLARAGVLPMLTRGKVIEGIDLWRHAILRPGEKQHQGNPCRALAAALQSCSALPNLRDESSTDPLEKLTKQLAQNPQGLVDRIDDQLSQHGRDELRTIRQTLKDRAAHFKAKGRSSDAKALENTLNNLADPQAALILIVDQAEEIFHGDRNESHVAAFITALSNLTRSGRIFVLLTLRSDFYDRYQAIPELLELVGESGRVDLLPPDSDEIGQIIRQPAAAAGLRYEENANGKTLDEELRDQACSSPESLPLLSHLLDLLVEKQKSRNDGWLHWQDYEDLGGVEGALSTHAEKVFTSQLDLNEQETFPHILSGLVHLGSGDAGEDTALRKDARLHDLTHDAHGKEIPGAAKLIEVFSGEHARLLTLYQDPDSGENFATISHEVLLRRWDRVKTWIRENADFLRRRARIESFHQQYLEALAKDRKENTHTAVDLLLPPGLPLEEGIALAATPDHALTTDLRNFIASSRAKDLARKKRLNRIRTAVFASLLILTTIASILGYLANSSEADAKRALIALKDKKDEVDQQIKETQKALAESRLNEGKAWLERANLAAEKGHHFTATMMAGKAIGYHGYGRSESNQKIPHLITTKHKKEFNRAQKIIQQQLAKTHLPVWVSPSIKHHHKVESITVSPNGKTLASASNIIRLWDIHTGATHGEPLRGHEGWITSLAFNPTGSIIASGSRDKTVRIWDVQTRKPIGKPLRGHKDHVSSVAFSPDGSILASASHDKTIRFWNVQTGKPIGKPIRRHEEWLTSIAFSPDGNSVATSSMDCSVKLWDRNTGKLIGKPLLGHEAPVTSITFTPCGTMIASASWDHTIRFWNPQTGKAIGSPLQGHTGEVRCIAFSSDGKTLASSSNDKTIRLWNTETKKLIGSPLRGLGAPAESLAFVSANSALAASSSANGTIILWDTLTGKRLGYPPLGHWDDVNSLACNADGNILASASDDKTIRLWNPHTGMPIGDPLEGHTDKVNSVKFHPDNNMLVSASDDKTIRLWSAHSGMPIGDPIKGHQSCVNSVTFNPDGSLLASASDDKSIRFWNVKSGKPYGTILRGHKNKVTSLAFSPDGNTLASASEDQTIRLWNVHTGMLIGNPLREHNGCVNSITFSPNGRLLASASDDNTILLWDINSASSQNSKVVFIPGRLEGHESGVKSVSFSPDGKVLASASHDKTIRLWDISSGELIDMPLYAHTDSVNFVTFTPDGRMLASASRDNTVRLWKAMPDEYFIKQLEQHNKRVTSVAFSPDCSLLASSSADKTIRLWDVHSGKKLGSPLLGHTGSVTSIAYSSDGKMFASASRNSTIQLWNTLTGKPIGEPLVGHEDLVTSLAFNPQNGMLASGSWDKTVRLWDVRTQKTKGKPLRGHIEIITSVAFSPDGNLLASASGDNTVRLWDTLSGRPVGDPLAGHEDNVTSVAFSSDGSLLASASGDHTIRLWDTFTRKPHGLPLRGHEDWLHYVIFSPDGRFLASTSDDKTIRLWNIHTGELVGSPLLGHKGGANSIAFSFDGKMFVSVSDSRIRVWLTRQLLSQNRVNLANYITTKQLQISEKGIVWSNDTHTHSLYSNHSTAPMLNAPPILPKRGNPERWQALLQTQNWPMIFRELSHKPNGLNQQNRNLLAQSYLVTLVDDFRKQAPRLHALLPHLSEIVTPQLISTGKLDLPITTLANQVAKIKDPIVHAKYWPRFFELIKQRPNLINDYSTLKSLASDVSHYETKLSLYHKILSHADANAEDFYQIAYAAAIQNQLERTKEIFNNAHTRFPDNTDIYRHEGWAMVNLRKYDDSIKAFQKALKLTQKPIADNYLGLAIAYRLQDKTTQAISSYQEAINLDNKWASEKTITALDWPKIEKDTLLRVLKSIHKIHPENQEADE